MLHTIAFYNVENLYTVVNNNSLNKGISFPGNRSWNLSRYYNKLLRVVKVITAIGEEETNHLPTFFGLCEIENQKVIQDLLGKFSYNIDYGFVHRDSLDQRGIDTAFFYNKEFFTLEESDFIRIPIYNEKGEEDFTRDITYAKGKINNNTLHFFVVHLPSKRDKDINKPKRILLLKELRKKIDIILEQDKNANIIMMGDFNENPDESYFNEEFIYRGVNKEDKELFNPFKELYKEGKFSMIHNSNGALFDQIIFSKSFLNQENSFLYLKADVFNAPFLQDLERGRLGAPWRTYSGSRYLGGYSDHFPVYAIIKSQ